MSSGRGTLIVMARLSAAHSTLLRKPICVIGSRNRAVTSTQLTRRGRGFRWAGVGLAAEKSQISEFIIFNQQFLALIHAGLPILKSLDLLTRRMKNPYFQQLLTDISARVKSGALLSEAFEAQGVFAKVYTASLYAGEKSGNLEEVIRRYIEYQRIIDATRSKVKSAITYPIILTVLLVVLVTYLMAVVVPQFATFYEGLNAQLPQVTLTLIAISRSIREHLVTAVLLISRRHCRFADLEPNRERRICCRWHQAAAAHHWRPLEQVRVFAAEPHALHTAIRRNPTGQCARDCGRLVR